MELEHAKRLLALNRHLSATSTVALLPAIAGITSLLLHAVNMFEVLVPAVEVSFPHAAYFR